MTAAGDAPLLTVVDLHVRIPTNKGVIAAVRGVSFALGREKLGIVGESGSGKTMTGRAILRLVPPPGEIAIFTKDGRALVFDAADLDLPIRQRKPDLEKFLARAPEDWIFVS